MKQKQYIVRYLLTCLEEAEKARLCKEVNVWRAVNILSGIWIEGDRFRWLVIDEEAEFRVNGGRKWLRLGEKSPCAKFHVSEP